MKTITKAQKYNLKKILLFLSPSILIMLLIFPIGIDTNLTSNNLTAHEADSPGPAMRLEDISNGFSREDPCRPYSIFPSIAISTVYVPYIWLRAGILPPYDLNEFRRERLGLISELTIIARIVNMFAALGILILGFFVILVIGENLWASAFVSMSIALNPNLMFQASVTYYENCAIFWVFLSLLFYVRLWIGRGRVHRSLFLFAACSALAIATHDRMAGYYFLSIPALIFKMYLDNRSEKSGVKNATYSTLFLFVIGTAVFLLANNIIGAGIKPIQDYLVYKYSGGAVLPDRMKSIWSFLRNQLGCHWQTVRLLFWNLGGGTLFISFLGFWHLWKKKFYAGLIILLFPLGYQIICVGVPGWTVGRYILGQTLFVTLFAGLGVIWLLINMPRLGKIIIVAALIAQFATTIAVKAADTHFNPIRITEKMITKENGPNIVNAVGVRGFRKYESYDCFPETWNKRPDIRFTYIHEGDKFSGDFDMIVSDSEIPVNKSFKIKREMHIKPPVWLTKLVKKWCYLYSAGPTEIYIQIKQD